MRGWLLLAGVAAAFGSNNMANHRAWWPSVAMAAISVTAFALAAWAPSRGESWFEFGNTDEPEPEPRKERDVTPIR